MEKRTAAEQDYIAEKTRQLLADVWADRQLRGITAIEDSIPVMPYIEFALEKKWLSVVGGGQPPEYRVLAVGFKAAAAYLRR